MLNEKRRTLVVAHTHNGQILVGFRNPDDTSAIEAGVELKMYGVRQLLVQMGFDPATGSLEKIALVTNMDTARGPVDFVSCIPTLAYPATGKTREHLEKLIAACVEQTDKENAQAAGIITPE